MGATALDWLRGVTVPSASICRSCVFSVVAPPSEPSTDLPKPPGNRTCWKGETQLAIAAKRARRFRLSHLAHQQRPLRHHELLVPVIDRLDDERIDRITGPRICRSNGRGEQCIHGPRLVLAYGRCAAGTAAGLPDPKAH